MTDGFVSYKRVGSVQDLKVLLDSKELNIEPNYYFLCWSDEVSGIRMKPPDRFPSPEGQMFNSKLEVRWKKQGAGYELLLLSIEPKNILGFEAISGAWKTCDRPAYFYNTGETRFPNGFIFKDEKNENIAPKDIPIGQRYFQDAKTATVHFIALTVRTDK